MKTKQELIDLLKTDVQAFNKFREENPDFKIDLIDANLTDANLTDANLTDANLKFANLKYANLIGTNLKFANLKYANLDFASWPLHCGSLKPKTDERQRIQLGFHFASLIKHAEAPTKREIEIYNSILDYVNEFHRIDVERLEEIK